MIGDYAGVPVSDAGRWRAESWSPDDYDLAEYACRPHAWDYSLEGPLSQMRMWADVDHATQKVMAYHGHLNQQEQETTIWMDGRPHPSPNAPHERGGFTTGAWEGDTLVAYTTHMRAGVIRRNGAPNSDQATMTSYFFRNGDLLTLLVVVEDPVYLTEPYMISKNFQLDSAPMRPIGPPCVPGYEGQDGDVPHYLPGANPSIDELTTLYHIPRDAILGGAPTMYPEFRKAMKATYIRPEKCARNCGGPPRP